MRMSQNTRTVTHLHRTKPSFCETFHCKQAFGSEHQIRANSKWKSLPRVRHRTYPQHQQPPLNNMLLYCTYWHRCNLQGISSKLRTAASVHQLIQEYWPGLLGTWKHKGKEAAETCSYALVHWNRSTAKVPEPPCCFSARKLCFSERFYFKKWILSKFADNRKLGGAVSLSKVGRPSRATSIN